MANFFGGVIPTFPISSNGAINSFTNNLIKDLGGTAINVALNKTVSEEWSKTLGIPTLDNPFNNLVSSTSRNLLSNSQQLFSDLLSRTGSGLPSIIGNVANNLVQTKISNLVQDALLSISRGSLSLPPPVKWFPGTSISDPVANYGGTSYTSGLNGADVVFSIIPSVSGATREIWTDQFDPKSKVKLNYGQITPPGTSVNYFSRPYKPFDPTKTFFADVGTPEFYSSLGVEYGSSGTEGSPFQKNYSSIAFPKVGWNFTCTPDNISWNTEAQVERVSIFGTNQPPVVSGSKTMRDLTMSDALIEGFSLGRTVEDKIAELENLMSFTIDNKNRFVRVPVYYVKASDKKYGNGANGVDGGFFVIKSISVKERMRDLSGKTTRAIVDVVFTQVPGYQVNKGRDTANVKFLGQKSFLGVAAERITKFYDKANQIANPNPQRPISQTPIEGGLNPGKQGVMRDGQYYDNNQ